MKEFIDKLIGRLEEEKKKQQYLFNNVLNNEHQRMIHEYAEQCYLYMTDIVNQLAEEHNGGWIPVSERLPEHGGVYIVMIEGAKKTTTLKLKIDGWADEFDNLYKVIAWMPMPPAYVPKGE